MYGPSAGTKNTGRYREFKIRVNVWTVRRGQKSGRCREVTVSGGRLY